MGPFFAGLGSLIVNAANIINKIYVTVKALTVVAQTIIVLCKELGLIEDKSIEVDELGEKALAAEEQGIKPEQFETYEQYVKEIEKFEVTFEKAAYWNQEDKVKKGTIVATGLLLEKFGPIVNDLLVEINKRPEYFTTDRMKVYLDLASNQDLDINEVAQYLDGEMKGLGEKKAVNEKMLEIESKIHPTMTLAELQQLINEQKR